MIQCQTAAQHLRRLTIISLLRLHLVQTHTPSARFPTSTHLEGLVNLWTGHTSYARKLILITHQRIYRLFSVVHKSMLLVL
jgi:hypothetical protein